ncbi:aminotransferase class I/II-fold pyridoxal phosphate-dependent enzyme [Marinovum sp. SP66]|uniref:aminotransferase class I/II-fold pyridoxal phosphate-dependent enzyme n=1 Tax=Marinovum TaxID=367771 RepID=UPI00237A1819|nr:MULTISPECIES: aminotransferase class I/II-fold pyridoxal phosphate-dependent enzyme [unclassified Marinovum]MDD9741508.1 aminotransferase class I/II-fold pyridoxal phosphate-dependent enzyme [Marinovum sp. SP66]MDD9743797.1 aminotransferase class I/II-fold pyridoxal phosphate-dependent enzyme [Marinovum sp. PR37]
MFPERFSNLPAYAFPRLRALLDPHAPAPAHAQDVLHMTIGEPQHEFPAFVGAVLADNLAGFGKYPPNDGTPELRAAIADWARRRYGVTLDAETQVMPLNGSREGLYNAAMALCPEQKNGQRPVVLTPNPFYQVYMIAAISVAAEPVFVPATAATGHLPDYAGLPEEVLNRTAMAYICSPANPQGAIASAEYWRTLIGLAERYDFRIVADECYSEIYRDAPPTGVLEIAAELGADPERIILINSLSKRSNLPGLRSGFIAGGPQSIARVKQLRAYSGAPLPLPLQRVSEWVWADEAHVVENRALYQAKYAVADEVFAGVAGYAGPEAGFFLWLPVDDGEAAAVKAWQETAVRVLPGAYLSRDVSGANPGQGYIRVAMVAPIDDMRRGLTRLRDCLYEVR